jgi:hypothetical protein
VGDDAGQVDRRLDAGVAAADHRHALALEQRAVAVRAVGHALGRGIPARRARSSRASGRRWRGSRSCLQRGAAGQRALRQPPSSLAGTSASARCRFMMSTSYSLTCCSSAAASFGPSVSLHRDEVLDGQRVQHLAAEALGDDAGADALARGVDGRRRAGRAAADDQHVEGALARSSRPRGRRRRCRAWRRFPRSMRPWPNTSPFR